MNTKANKFTFKLIYFIFKIRIYFFFSQKARAKIKLRKDEREK